ncbi:hypothetical protein I7I51_02425 [Histoplasma capsulatum]|uniref:Uncharacterized protein n=1 Tax=Ajellomyces capsulatus TaxID=5037 RepID=A0A8A1M853_AJECA|nr:hypothetical protein I7I51_02425 [Histoplasma capsulatum]
MLGLHHSFCVAWGGGDLVFRGEESNYLTNPRLGWVRYGRGRGRGPATLDGIWKGIWMIKMVEHTFVLGWASAEPQSLIRVFGRLFLAAKLCPRFQDLGEEGEWRRRRCGGRGRRYRSRYMNRYMDSYCTVSTLYGVQATMVPDQTESNISISIHILDMYTRNNVMAGDSASAIHLHRLAAYCI